jgi:geranylgeranyl diphosphate synthase, type II
MKTTENPLAQLLAPFQQEIENKILLSIENLGPKSPLRDACEYALMNGGKRFRPVLVHLIAKALNPEADVTLAALAVEYFHTASLVADDLPCMDDDDLRRNKPSVHKVYGEATSLLVSYALIAAGYEALADNAKLLGEANFAFSENCDQIGLLAIKNASQNTGLLGATGGQYLDISPPDLNRETLQEIIRLKTVTLFEISFVLGWLYGGGPINQLDLVKKLAHHFGMAFQIADDFDDVEQDAKNGRKVNMVAVCGEKEAFNLFHMELNAFKSTSNELGINIPELHLMCNLMERLFKI